MEEKRVVKSKTKIYLAIIIILIIGFALGYYYISILKKENKDNIIIEKTTIKTKFSYDDLIVDKLSYGMSEEQVLDIMGKPDNKEESSVDNFDIYGKSISYTYGELRIAILSSRWKDVT